MPVKISSDRKITKREIAETNAWNRRVDKEINRGYLVDWFIVIVILIMVVLVMYGCITSPVTAG